MKTLIISGKEVTYREALDTLSKNGELIKECNIVTNEMCIYSLETYARAFELLVEPTDVELCAAFLENRSVYEYIKKLETSEIVNSFISTLMKVQYYEK